MADKLTTEINGKPMIWNGHLCEGDEMVSGNRATFLLWTRCHKHDVPADSAHLGTTAEVTCDACAALSKAEGRGGES